MTRGPTLVLAAVLLLTACGARNGTSTPVAEEGVASPASSGWEPIPPAPLSARWNAVGVAVGGEVLLTGGESTRPCPPNASCSIPPGPLFRDGAAYDPATGAWRRIADAPEGFRAGGVAVVGTVLYVSVPSGFAAYDTVADAWSRVSSPPRYLSGEPLLAMGDRLLLLARSQEDHVHRDWAYDPATRSWEALPPDPLAPSFDRAGVWTGERLVVTGKELVDQPGSDGPSLARVAAYDPAEGTWKRLPDTGQIGGGHVPWQWAAGRAVALEPGGADGGATNNYGRDYPFGGVLDAEGRWSPLPPLPRSDRVLPYHASGDDEVAVTQGLALHVPSGRAVSLPRDERLPDEGAAFVWLGDRLYVWGGVRWHGDGMVRPDSPEPAYAILAEGFSWRPFSP